MKSPTKHFGAKIWAIILSLTLVLTMIPLTALAQEDEPPQDTTSEISAFAPLDEGLAGQYWEKGTPIDQLSLPDALSATVQTISQEITLESQEQIPVSAWVSTPAYDPDALGTYIFTPTLALPEGITLASDVTPPTITVTIKEFDQVVPTMVGDVDINATNFPDANFRAWILSQSYGADSILSADEISSITTINVNGQSIATLEGIQNFTALQTLNCYDNQLSSLDVSALDALETLDCSDNQLTSLNATNCTALQELYCSGNQLTSLNVTNCIALQDLYCYNNQLSSLDVSDCIALTILDCDANKLTSLDVTKCTALTELACDANKLTSLDVTKCTALTRLGCYDNKLTSLDVTKCTALQELICSSNKLSSLDVTKCTVLTRLGCGDNQLSSLDLTKCTALTTLACNDNKLTSLDLSGCAALKGLDCSINQLTSLDVSSCTALTELYCSKNPLNQENLFTLKSLTLEYFEYTENGSTYLVGKFNDKILTIKIIGNGFVYPVFDGSDVTLESYPDDGYDFLYWQDAVGLTDLDVRSTMQTIPSTSDTMSITAVFSVDPSRPSASTPPPTTWLEATPAGALSVDAKNDLASYVRTRSTGEYGVRRAALQSMIGLHYEHDTILANGTMQVRVVIPNPQLATADLMVSGYVKGETVDFRQASFERWFTNQVRILHLDQQAPWGQSVNIAAKIDLTGMNANNLVFYSYDKVTNLCKRIQNPSYWIDTDGYLRFTTDQAGDIVISDGPLLLK